MVVAFAALAGLKIELQGDRIPHGRHGRFDRRLGEHRPAKIGVQDSAAQVEERARARAVLSLETGPTFNSETSPPSERCVSPLATRCARPRSSHGSHWLRRFGRSALKEPPPRGCSGLQRPKGGRAGAPIWWGPLSPRFSFRSHNPRSESSANRLPRRRTDRKRHCFGPLRAFDRQCFQVGQRFHT